jgi:RNA polymerase sigma-70 factor, ECF subfamily
VRALLYSAARLVNTPEGLSTWRSPVGAISMTEHAATKARSLYVEAPVSAEAQALDARFAHLYASAFPRVYGFVRTQVANVQTAQEVVSRIFLKAYQHCAKAPEGSEAFVWLFRIAHTVLIDYRRVEGRRDAVNVSIDEVAEFAGDLPNPEAAYAAKERVAAVLSAMNETDRDDRMILGLKFTGHRTNREIAEILGLSEGAVSMRLLRALRRLRERLLERGITP